MADKKTTARLLAEWLGDTPLQVRLTFSATDSWMHGIENGRESIHTSTEYIKEIIHPFSAISHKKFDGFVLTGFNSLEKRVEQEKLYPEAVQIIDHMETHATSSLFLCYGAKAALYHRHGIVSSPQANAEKYFGVFNFTRGPHPDETGILRGLPDEFAIPVARMKSPNAEQIISHSKIRTIANSVESGTGIMVETAFFNGNKLYPTHVYVMPHPEYDPKAMDAEYIRDLGNGLNIPFPKGLYRDNDMTQGPINSWRHTGRIYTNWVHAVYEATPFKLEQVPQPFHPSHVLGRSSPQPLIERGVHYG